MLSEEIIEKLTERLVNRIEQGNSYILEQIGKSVKEIKNVNPSQARQLAQILKYGGSYDKIIKKLAEITDLNVRDIYTIFEKVAKRDYGFAKQFYDYRNINYIPYEENEALKRQVRALASVTANEYVNLSKTSVIGFTTKDIYGRTIFKDLSTTYQGTIDISVLNILQGKTTFDQEMLKTIKELGESGLKTVDYASGRSMRLDSAVRMNIQGALRDTHNYLQEQFGQEYGADGVEISVHSAPAIDHEDAQGRQFTKEEYKKLQSIGIAKDYTDKTIDMTTISSSGVSYHRPISQMNCYHYIFSIVLGVNKPEYSEEELKKIIEDNKDGFTFEDKDYTMYEGTQLQRRIETEIRRQKDVQIIARASGNQELINKSQTKINQLTEKYKELCEVSDLKPKLDRLRVSGYHKVAIRDKNSKK